MLLLYLPSEVMGKEVTRGRQGCSHDRFPGANSTQHRGEEREGEGRAGGKGKVEEGRGDQITQSRSNQILPGRRGRHILPPTDPDNRHGLLENELLTHEPLGIGLIEWHRRESKLINELIKINP